MKIRQTLNEMTASSEHLKASWDRENKVSQVLREAFNIDQLMRDLKKLMLNKQ